MTEADEVEDLYFAYGPDMDPAVLRARGGRPEAVAVARLSDYKLAFFGYTETWDSGMETVAPDPGGEVWGVVYRLRPWDWDNLDAWMDARLDGAGMYFHYPDEVTDLSGKTHSVRFYKKNYQGEPRLPSVPYLDLVVGGAGQQGLPIRYVERLRCTVAHKPAFAVPVPGNPERGVFVKPDCGTCEAAEDEDFEVMEVETC